MRNKFEVKTPDLLVWNGRVVMSRTEGPFFRRLFKLVSKFPHRRVLEVGYGLGVSAHLIQEVLAPESHDIVEIDETIHKDLKAFARRHRGVRAIHGDFWTFKPRAKYDFAFYDPFDYTPDESTDDGDEEYDDSKSERVRELLVPGGIICCPVFGDEPPEPMPGLRRVMNRRLKVPPMLLDEGTETRDAAVVCWQVD